MWVEKGKVSRVPIESRVMSLSNAELTLSNKLDVKCEGAVLPVVFTPSEVVEMALVREPSAATSVSHSPGAWDE